MPMGIDGLETLAFAPCFALGETAQGFLTARAQPAKIVTQPFERQLNTLLLICDIACVNQINRW